MIILVVVFIHTFLPRLMLLFSSLQIETAFFISVEWNSLLLAKINNIWQVLFYFVRTYKCRVFWEFEGWLSCCWSWSIYNLSWRHNEFRIVLCFERRSVHWRQSKIYHIILSFWFCFFYSLLHHIP